MDTRQAKLRFTELTGYKALRLNFYRALADKGVSVNQWVKYRWEQYDGNAPIKDYRCAHMWVSIVSFFETLEEAV